MLLVPLLLSKFPSRLNLHLSRKFESNADVWKVEDVMKEVRKELEARERCYVEQKEPPKQVEPGTIDALVARFKSEGITIGKTSLESLIAGAESAVKKANICPYCDGKHFGDQCRTVTDIPKRKDILKTKRMCFLCTKKNHVANQCKSKKTCYKCKGAHHTSICETPPSTDNNDWEGGNDTEQI